MRSHSWSITAFALLATLGVALAAPPDELKKLDGEWIYVEDRTEGREVEQQSPSMSPRLTLRVEEGAVVLIRGTGSRKREIRMALDGSPTDVAGSGKSPGSRYRGEWKDGAYQYEIGSVDETDKAKAGPLKIELRPTADGLLVRVKGSPPREFEAVSLFRHPQDIALPTPAKATIGDIEWLAGAWVGKMGAEGTRSIEERWSPPLGGAMLATSRTVSRDRMVAFEFLRLSERDGKLVYIAQPNGGAATEFVCTEVSKSRAVFENPRHDSPQRIVYELSAEGGLSASVGFAKGGKPQRFEFKREGNAPAKD
jgi:hypothetical protein